MIHPFPTVLVACSAGGLGLVAGGTMAQVAMLTLAMAGFQASIGAINDLVDRDRDAIAQPWKPIPSRHISLSSARWAAAAGAALGIVGSLVLGAPTLAVGLLGFGLGLAYDLGLKRTAWGWLCLALALPLVPVFAWLGVGAGWPPQTATLFLLGALAGSELAIANGLVDASGDHRTGGRGIAVRLGPERARAAMVAAATGVLVVAGASFVALRGMTPATPGSSMLTALGLLAGGALIVAGVVMALRHDERWAWRGWQTQAGGIAVVAVVWLMAIA